MAGGGFPISVGPYIILDVTSLQIQIQIQIHIHNNGRWRLPYLSWPIHHPCHKHATWLDTNTHSQQWQERWAQFCSQNIADHKEVSHLKAARHNAMWRSQKGKLLLCFQLKKGMGLILFPINIFLISLSQFCSRVNTEIMYMVHDEIFYWMCQFLKFNKGQQSRSPFILLVC